MSYDIAIVRSDVPDDLAFDLACLWECRDHGDDVAGAQCNPTSNYARFLDAFHVHPVHDLHGKSALRAATLIDAALSDIRTRSVAELEDAYFRTRDGEPIRWGSIPDAIAWLEEMADYCRQHPDYKLIGQVVWEDEDEVTVSLGTVGTFDDRYREPTRDRCRKLLEETGELATVQRWLDADGRDDMLRQRMIGEYCDVVEALGTLAIAYGITGREIRFGMVDCEKRYRDGVSGGAKSRRGCGHRRDGGAGPTVGRHESERRRTVNLATCEALEYEEHTEGADCTIINGAFTTGDLAVEAYYAGWTAPATDTEVEAAALALFRFDTNWARSEPSDSQVREWWDCQPEMIRERFMRRARLALETVRESVAANPNMPLETLERLADSWGVVRKRAQKT